MAKVFPILGSLKCYEWGKYGNESIIIKLQKNAISNFEYSIAKPYAELWMGTHDSGPSIIPSQNNLKLIEWIKQNPQSLGSNIVENYGDSKGLPFLFKVLSVEKALSIQVHPNKQMAERLHNAFPERYPDDNHKPEMAIALSNFQALCGFRPAREIQEFIFELRPLQIVIGEEAAENFLQSATKENLKAIFTNLMTCLPQIFKPQIIALESVFSSNKIKSNLIVSIKKLFFDIKSNYPDDIGIFCIFFLNYLSLKPNEAIFLAANEPHAYIKGDCIECMACSDNVVRAGLTPKFKDVQTLCDILSYECKQAEDNLFSYVLDPNDPYLKTYNPPVKEFAVDHIAVSKNDKTYSLKALKSASILLLIMGNASYGDGNKQCLTSGSIIFISSDIELTLTVNSNLFMFRAYCSG